MFMIFIVLSCQRHDEDIFIEVVIWPGGGGERNTPIYYFVVTNNGTLISYAGFSRSGIDHPRRHNFLRSVQERTEVVLSEEDFQYISELVSVIVSGESEGEFWTNSRVVLLYNGNIYENSTVWTYPETFNLVVLIIELTPFPVGL